MKEEKRKNSAEIDLDQELQNLPDETQRKKDKRKPNKASSASSKSSASPKSGASSRSNASKPKVLKTVPEETIPEVMNPKKKSSRKEKKRSKNMGNKELMKVTYLFVALFLVMGGYLVYFNVVKSKDVINSPYNVRQDLMADRVVRGKIVSAEGDTLAETIVAEDGSESRNYPYGNIFAHVVGYANNGKAGLESIQNFNLLTSNAFFLERLTNEFQDKKNMGDTVVTTLNSNLQTAAYQALGDNKGAVVVMEATTGKIVAMVSKPAFDSNTVAENWDALNNDVNSSLLNRATLGSYTPGSTFKMVTALEYMRENVNYAQYSFTCNGEMTYDGTTIHCYNSNAHGLEGLAESVAYSCNSSFSNIGLSLDIGKWRKTAKDLLFNRNLPSDLPYRNSTFALKEGASSAEVMMTAIGQGETQVSPYHMALIMSAVANGGTLMKPYLVDQITNYKGTNIKKYMPKKYDDLMTSAEAAQLMKYLTDVVDYGTGTALGRNGYSVAGKTGTAEVSMDKETVNSWFVGVSNIDNPELVVSVVIENADTASITGTAVAKQIWDAYYN